MARVAPLELASDALFPRDEEHRYRVYFRRGADLGIPVATDCLEGVGAAIGALDSDAREVGLRGVVDLGVLGILDALEGRWIVLPWERPEADPTFGRLPTPIAKGRKR